MTSAGGSVSLLLTGARRDRTRATQLAAADAARLTVTSINGAALAAAFAIVVALALRPETRGLREG